MSRYVETMLTQRLHICFVYRRRRNGELYSVVQHRPLIGRQIDFGVVLLDRFDERIVVGLCTESLSVSGRSIATVIRPRHDGRDHFALAPRNT